MKGTGFIPILIFGILFGLLHSSLASARLKRWIAQLFQVSGTRYYRLAFAVTATVTAMAYAGSVLLLPDRRMYTIPHPWIIITIVIQLAAAYAILVCLFQSGLMSFLGLDVLFDLKLMNPAETLKVDGFYRYMRHPIYSFSFLVMWLFPVMTWNLMAFFIGCTVYSLIGSYFEEQRLLEQFGVSYKEYRERTAAFIPKIF
jgi:protein-S-isoprenylcysteine O-methyltransferase Ste14